LIAAEVLRLVHRFVGAMENRLGIVSRSNRGNTDADAAFEFELLIKDGAVPESAYTADDFLL
jgi:hypothetical protein